MIIFKQAVATRWVAANGSLQLDLVKDWTMLELQPARLGQRPTFSTQGPIRLRHACQITVTAQRAAAASRLLGPIGLLPTVAKVSAYAFL